MHLWPQIQKTTHSSLAEWVVFGLLRRSPNPQKHRTNPAATRLKIATQEE